MKDVFQLPIPLGIFSNFQISEGFLVELNKLRS